MATKKTELTTEEMEAKEQEEFNTGPLRVLTDSVKSNTQVGATEFNLIKNSSNTLY